MTSFIVQPAADVRSVDDSLLATYVAAGWTQASATQYAAWAAADPYGGLQGAPPAPPLISVATPTSPAVAPGPATWGD